MSSPGAPAESDPGVAHADDAGPSSSANVKTKIRAPSKGNGGAAPRQSAATQLQLRVLRLGIERLMTERKTLKEVKDLMIDILRDLDNEIKVVEAMRKLANHSFRFQHGSLNVDVKTPAADSGIKIKVEIEDMEVDIKEETT